MKLFFLFTLIFFLCSNVLGNNNACPNKFGAVIMQDDPCEEVSSYLSDDELMAYDMDPFKMLTDIGMEWIKGEDGYIAFRPDAAQCAMINGNRRRMRR